MEKIERETKFKSNKIGRDSQNYRESHLLLEFEWSFWYVGHRHINWIFLTCDWIHDGKLKQIFPPEHIWGIMY